MVWFLYKVVYPVQHMILMALAYCIASAPSLILLSLLAKSAFLKKCPRVYNSNSSLRWFAPLYIAVVGSFPFFLAFVAVSYAEVYLLGIFAMLWLGLLLVAVVSLFFWVIDRARIKSVEAQLENCPVCE